MDAKNTNASEGSAACDAERARSEEEERKPYSPPELRKEADLTAATGGEVHWTVVAS